MAGCMRKMTALVAGAIAALVPIAASSMPPASEWTIGPIIRGKNYSVGMPLQPDPTRTGWSFEFPSTTRAAGHVHYVTFDPGTLADRSRIVIRYRVHARAGTRFVPQEHPTFPGAVSLFLQRSGDNWSARGRYNFYRWYSPGHTVQELAPGTHEMIVRLDDPEWIAVMGGDARSNPAGFRAALSDPSAIGLVFGSVAARGHGVFATAPARFELLSFEIE